MLGQFALLAAGFTLGTAGISSVEQRLRRSQAPAPAPIAGAEAGVTLSAPQVAAYHAAAVEARRVALRTGLTIAVAIGLHNFAEGLAIGVSAKAGAIGLATVLIIGFGLHNATEGFGIVGPLGGVRPSWGWLGLAGLIGGGPTFLGTLVGYQVHSPALELAFYALAGGAILYVVGEIWIGDAPLRAQDAGALHARGGLPARRRDRSRRHVRRRLAGPCGGSVGFRVRPPDARPDSSARGHGALLYGLSIAQMK